MFSLFGVLQVFLPDCLTCPNSQYLLWLMSCYRPYLSQPAWYVSVSVLVHLMCCSLFICMEQVFDLVHLMLQVFAFSICYRCLILFIWCYRHLRRMFDMLKCPMYLLHDCICPCLFDVICYRFLSSFWYASGVYPCSVDMLRCLFLFIWYVKVFVLVHLIC